MKGMTVIVKTISSWIKVLIFMFGIYIIIFGHITPGGGFAGGVILAASYILLMLAFGREFVEENLSLKWAGRFDCVGALMFAAIALFGLFYGATSFFYNFFYQEYQAGEETAFKLVSAGTIPISNIAIGLKVWMSLFLIVLVLSMFRTSGKTPDLEKE
jgi:multisubunit Na+/H+ antiporter MnhB subunit